MWYAEAVSASDWARPFIDDEPEMVNVTPKNPTVEAYLRANPGAFPAYRETIEADVPPPRLPLFWAVSLPIVGIWLIIVIVGVVHGVITGRY
jgi:hypothetical protein